MTDRLDGTAWTLIAPLDTPDGVDITLSFAEGRAAGYAGCNRFGADYRIDDDVVSFGPAMTTRMACDDDAMQAEAEFLARLADTAGFLLDDDTLALLDGDGAALLEFRAEGTVGLHGDWIVNGLHFPAREAIMSVNGELLVHFDDEGVSGFAGCNSFSGALDADGDSVRIGPLMSTRRFCGEDEESDGPSVMEQEAALLAALENSSTARLEGDRLILLRPDGGISVTLHRG